MYDSGSNNQKDHRLHDIPRLQNLSKNHLLLQKALQVRETTQNLHKKCQPASKRRRKLTKLDINNILHELTNVDPPTYQELGDKYNVTRMAICKIKQKFGLKTVKKVTGHAMSSRIIMLRKQRSLPLKKKLLDFGLDRIVSSDEAWFYAQNQGKRNIQHLTKRRSRCDAEVLTKKSHPIAVMVWAAVCHRGIIGPFFVESGAKINSEYYIQAILKPALKQLRQLYPDGKFLWHHDSAPAHAAHKTNDYLLSHGVEYISKAEWLPCSPDISPCDYSLWGYLKPRVRKNKNVKTLDDLKSAIIKEFSKVPLDFLVKTINAFPTRLQEVYNENGNHLKKRL